MTVTRRAAAASDEPFLRALDADVRGPLFAGLPVALLEQQYDARRAAREGARREVIEVDGRPVGELVTDGGHVLDLAIVADARGQGIGTAVVRELAAAGDVLRVEVEAANVDARRFYERLGFRGEETDGVTVTLRRASGPATG